MALKDLLKNKLTKKELALVPTSFDLVGNKEKAVAIIEIPDELKKKAKTIAFALMKQHKNVYSVLLKKSPRKGVYRTREMKINLAGDSAGPVFLFPAIKRDPHAPSPKTTGPSFKRHQGRVVWKSK